MINPPRFSARIDTFNGKTLLRIWDTSDAYPTAPSVTNSAEYVLDQLEKENGQLPELIIYKDTLGYWDKMCRRADGTVVFSPIIPSTKNIQDDDDAAQLATGGKQ